LEGVEGSRLDDHRTGLKDQVVVLWGRFEGPGAIGLLWDGGGLRVFKRTLMGIQ